MEKSSCLDEVPGCSSSSSDARKLQKAILVLSSLGPMKDVNIVFIWQTYPRPASPLTIICSSSAENGRLVCCVRWKASLHTVSANPHEMLSSDLNHCNIC